MPSSVLQRYCIKLYDHLLWHCRMQYAIERYFPEIGKIIKNVLGAFIMTLDLLFKNNLFITQRNEYLLALSFLLRYITRYLVLMRGYKLNYNGLIPRKAWYFSTRCYGCYVIGEEAREALNFGSGTYPFETWRNCQGSILNVSHVL